MVVLNTNKGLYGRFIAILLLFNNIPMDHYKSTTITSTRDNQNILLLTTDIPTNICYFLLQFICGIACLVNSNQNPTHFKTLKTNYYKIGIILNKTQDTVA